MLLFCHHSVLFFTSCLFTAALSKHACSCPSRGIKSMVKRKDSVVMNLAQMGAPKVGTSEPFDVSKV